MTPLEEFEVEQGAADGLALLAAGFAIERWAEFEAYVRRTASVRLIADQQDATRLLDVLSRRLLP